MDSFTVGDQEIVLNSTPGFKNAGVANDVNVLVLVDTLQHGKDAGIRWSRKEEMEQTPRFFIPYNFLKLHIKEAETLATTGSSLLGSVRIHETELPETIHVVPDLNPYIQKGVPLLLEPRAWV